MSNNTQTQELRALLATQGWAKDWAFDIVPSGKPAHELACKAVRALPALLDHIERLQAEIARREANEYRNCINWGPCSAHDGRMSEDDPQ